MRPPRQPRGGGARLSPPLGRRRARKRPPQRLHRQRRARNLNRVVRAPRWARGAARATGESVARSSPSGRARAPRGPAAPRPPPRSCKYESKRASSSRGSCFTRGGGDEIIRFGTALTLATLLANNALLKAGHPGRWSHGDKINGLDREHPTLRQRTPQGRTSGSSRCYTRSCWQADRPLINWFETALTGGHPTFRQCTPQGRTSGTCCSTWSARAARATAGRWTDTCSRRPPCRWARCC